MSHKALKLSWDALGVAGHALTIAGVGHRTLDSAKCGCLNTMLSDRDCKYREAAGLTLQQTSCLTFSEFFGGSRPSLFIVHAQQLRLL